MASASMSLGATLRPANRTPPTTIRTLRFREDDLRLRIADRSAGSKRSEVMENPTKSKCSSATQASDLGLADLRRAVTLQPARSRCSSTSRMPKVCCSPGTGTSKACPCSSVRGRRRATGTGAPAAAGGPGPASPRRNRAGPGTRIRPSAGPRAPAASSIRASGETPPRQQLLHQLGGLVLLAVTNQAGKAFHQLSGNGRHAEWRGVVHLDPPCTAKPSSLHICRQRSWSRPRYAAPAPSGWRRHARQ